jgi:hypothetical protein
LNQPSSSIHNRKSSWGSAAGNVIESSGATIADAHRK